ncbi:MAG: DUF1016 N-terminal domain-containing protein, partial [Bacteroidales bacterium]|nr:DUF1016 N-terminal domain-containing protein [Bacteroidales bacterium]
MENFDKLITTIEQVHRQLQAAAASSVNQSLTVRNWLIGFYIVEFEQNGEDRAAYGDKLIEKLAGKLNHIKGIDKRSLFKFRQFYLFYPYIETAIRGSLTPVFRDKEKVGSLTTLLPDNQKVWSVTPQLKNQPFIPPQKILSKLSYT